MIIIIDVDSTMKKHRYLKPRHTVSLFYIELKIFYFPVIVSEPILQHTPFYLSFQETAGTFLNFNEQQNYNT